MNTATYLNFTDRPPHGSNTWNWEHKYQRAVQCAGALLYSYVRWEPSCRYQVIFGFITVDDDSRCPEIPNEVLPAACQIMYLVGTST
jgi:hypothetical protein